MAATFVIDENNVREIVEADAPELNEEQTLAAIDAVMGELEGGSICFYTLTEHLVREHANVDFADFAEDE